MLESEIVKLEQTYEQHMKQLETEDNDEGNHSGRVAERWEDQSDYQPTECGDDVSGYRII
jgi:hypothetical protein